MPEYRKEASSGTTTGVLVFFSIVDGYSYILFQVFPSNSRLPPV
nr:MAG TPA: hypothetical protein [Bacteriophage sp.]